ncbi:MAG: hypothetical protein ACXVW6_11825 [Nocardioidaceae bacterium]
MDIEIGTDAPRDDNGPQRSPRPDVAAPLSGCLCRDCQRARTL